MKRARSGTVLRRLISSYSFEVMRYRAGPPSQSLMICSGVFDAPFAAGAPPQIALASPAEADPQPDDRPARKAHIGGENQEPREQDRGPWPGDTRDAE